jgi:hypothetical protein
MRVRRAGYVARMGETRTAYKLMVGKPRRKRPLGRPKRRWEDNIRTDLRETGCEGVDWMRLAQGRDQWRAIQRISQRSEKSVSFIQ